MDLNNVHVGHVMGSVKKNDFMLCICLVSSSATRSIIGTSNSAVFVLFTIICIENTYCYSCLFSLIRLNKQK